MTLTLDALAFDANDPARMARFWAGLLGCTTEQLPDDGIALRPDDDTGFKIEFFPTGAVTARTRCTST